jgi:energy-converting hydrogenase Eha subunit E
MMQSTRFMRGLAIGEGGFWLLTGAWPVVHIGSFVAVTGPKIELWLVRTVGLLIAVIGGTLLSAGLRGRLTAELVGMAIAGPVCLAAIDVIYVSLWVIAPIYLGDAAVELSLALAWVVALLMSRGRA